jgi:hypothetical protein
VTNVISLITIFKQLNGTFFSRLEYVWKLHLFAGNFDEDF